jgi:hypothetical protein
VPAAFFIATADSLRVEQSGCVEDQYTGPFVGCPYSRGTVKTMNTKAYNVLICILPELWLCTKWKGE